MPAPALVEGEPRTAGLAGPASGGGGRHPAVLGAVSALMLWAAYPPADWSWFAWFALVPLFLLVPHKGSSRRLYLGAWVGGLIFWTLAIQWVRLTDESAWLAWLAMALALSAFWPLFLLLTRLAVFRARLPLMIAAPVVWVALEYSRAYLVTGFPWYYLAHTQHAMLPVIQIADVTGSLGVSFLIAVVNAWLVDLLTLPLLRPAPRPRLTAAQGVRLATVAGLLVVTLGYGGFRLATARFRPGPRVALLQSSIIQTYKDRATTQQILDIYRRLIDQAGRLKPRPDLIVWPETSFPYGYAMIDPALDDVALANQVRKITRLDPGMTVAEWRQNARTVASILHDWTDVTGIPMLFGISTYDHAPEKLSRYNSAVLLEPGRAGYQVYHKFHLVPFGEYVPLIETFPWLTVFTPYHGPNAYVPNLNFGTGPNVLNLGPYKVATAICFEDIVPQVVRRFFANPADGRPPDVLLNLSNDGWFKDSWEQRTHLAASIFRAVENRVPLARAANTGVSAIVDGNGRVVEMLATLKEGVVEGAMPLDDRSSLYSAWGDWLGLGCASVTIGVVPIALFRRRKAPRSPAT